MTVEVMARANLTVQGRLIVVGEVVDLDDTEEVRGLVGMDYLATRDPDTGNFPDVGPQKTQWGCGSCGGH